MWQQFLVVSMIVACHLCDANHYVQNQGPCNFLDTINITSGHLDQHGNYHHNGIIFQKGLFAEYKYVVENLTEVVRVEPHVRGCICSMKPCIRVCCNHFDQTNKTTCITGDTITVPMHDDEEVEIDLQGKTYGVLVGQPCGKMYKLEPQDYPDDRWYFVVSAKIISK